MNLTVPSLSVIICGAKAAIAKLTRLYTTEGQTKMSAKKLKNCQKSDERNGDFGRDFNEKLRLYCEINHFAIVDKREWAKWNHIKQIFYGK